MRVDGRLCLREEAAHRTDDLKLAAFDEVVLERQHVAKIRGHAQLEVRLARDSGRVDLTRREAAAREAEGADERAVHRDELAFVLIEVVDEICRVGDFLLERADVDSGLDDHEIRIRDDRPRATARTDFRGSEVDAVTDRDRAAASGSSFGQHDKDRRTGVADLCVKTRGVVTDRRTNEGHDTSRDDDVDGAVLGVTRALHLLGGIERDVARLVLEAIERIGGRVSPALREGRRNRRTPEKQIIEREDGVREIDRARVVRVDRVHAARVGRSLEEEVEDEDAVRNVDFRIAVTVAAYEERILPMDLGRHDQNAQKTQEDRERRASDEMRAAHEIPFPRCRGEKVEGNCVVRCS